MVPMYIEARYPEQKKSAARMLNNEACQHIIRIVTPRYQAEPKVYLFGSYAKGYATPDSDYDRFHYLNNLAATICAISHKTNVTVQGLRLPHCG